MFFNVVDAYTYKNYTDAIIWPFIRLNNACQCLDARIKHLFSMKIPLVNMEHKHWCTSVHTPCDVKQLMVFDVRWNVLRLSSCGIFTKKYIWRHMKLSECISMLMTCAAYECTNQFGFGKLSLQSRDSNKWSVSAGEQCYEESPKLCDDSYRQRCLRSQICKVCSSKIFFWLTIVHI